MSFFDRIKGIMFIFTTNCSVKMSPKFPYSHLAIGEFIECFCGNLAK